MAVDFAGIAEVEGRNLVPFWDHLGVALEAGGAYMLLEGVKVAQGGRIRDGRLERHLVDQVGLPKRSERFAWSIRPMRFIGVACAGKSIGVKQQLQHARIIARDNR